MSIYESREREGQERSRQLLRALAIAQVIKASFAPILSEIQRDLSDSFGIDASRRTLRRDLTSMVEVGLLRMVEDGRAKRYRFIRDKWSFM